MSEMSEARTMFQNASKMAKRISIEKQCSVYVNAIVQLVDETPAIVACIASDWYTDGSTLAMYHEGKLME